MRKRSDSQTGVSLCGNPNADIIVKMHQDRELKDICEKADLILTDGQIVVKLSRRYGTAIKERVCMTDFVWDVFDLAIEKEYKIFLLGGKEEILSKATENVKRSCPNLTLWIPIHRHLVLKGQKALAETNERIRNSHADILIVFFGMPKTREIHCAKQRYLSSSYFVYYGRLCGFSCWRSETSSKVDAECRT